MTKESSIDELAETTGLDKSEFDYVTNELIDELRDAKDEEDVEIEVIDDSGERLVLAGVYCNSLVPDSGPSGYLRYKRGDKGTSNYGCGNDGWRKKKQGTTYRQIGKCSGGRKKYLVTW